MAENSTDDGGVARPPSGVRVVLLACPEGTPREALTAHLERSGFAVAHTSNADGVRARMRAWRPDLVLCRTDIEGETAIELLGALRADDAAHRIPFILASPSPSAAEAVAAFHAGADDYVAAGIDADELVARVAAKIERPPIPRDLLLRDLPTGLLSTRALDVELAREQHRADRRGDVGSVACISIDEMESVRTRLGHGPRAELVAKLGAFVQAEVAGFDLVARDEAGTIWVVFPESDEQHATREMLEISRRVAGTAFEIGDERLQLTPLVGVTGWGVDDIAAPELRRRADLAMRVAAAQLDLQPVVWTPALDQQPPAKGAVLGRWGALRKRLRLPWQIAVTLIVSLVLPFIAYWAFDEAGFDVTPIVYIVVVAALVITAALIWVEGLLALPRRDPPELPDGPRPRATAIIAAYLPNEAATVVETVESFLKTTYTGEVQLILAYNTPRSMAVEATLRDIAARDPRFVALRVEDSNSKAQNVNAALAHATGEFTGVFDADHHPEPGSIERAWRWLADGADVVQGRAVVRNGEASWVARLVAVEFEAIYGVAHPGRARLHGWGIFGGSNGYWRTELLRKIRMRGHMLTEDIDSSMRVIEAGGRIVSDPYLVSRELATTTLKQLWNQRMRWAQGWYQVTLRHLIVGLRSPHLSGRQKAGFVHLLAWRELYPWLSVQVYPVIAFWVWHKGAGSLNWFVPVFVLTSLFTLATGPGQTYFAYRLASPEVRRRRGWFVFYLVVTSVFYAEFKNLIARVAQVKEAMRERDWRVTPRSP